MENLCKKYNWVEEICESDDGGMLVYTTFYTFDYVEALNAKSDHWVDEEGFDNDVTYFRVGGVSVTMCDYAFLIESENGDEISKVLEHINKVVS